MRAFVQCLMCLVLLIGCSSQAWSQWLFEANYQRAFLLSHRSNMSHLSLEPVNGLTCRAMKSMYGMKEWHQVYNFPEVGILAKWSSLGNTATLGSATTLAAIFSAPAFARGRFTYQLEMAGGLAYLSKKFDHESNYKNIAIGSHINAYIMLGHRLRFRLTPSVSMIGSMSFDHYSNAAYALPNLGLNYPTTSLGLQWHPNHKDTTYMVPIASAFSKPRWTIAFGVGIKESTYFRAVKYPAFSLIAERQWTLSRKSFLAPGIDVMLDRSKQFAINDTANIAQNIQAGIHVNYGLWIDDFRVSLAMGVYLLDQIRTEGRLYHRAGMQYYFDKHWGMQLNLKTHFFKADYFELGATYRF